ncbi:MAG: hypothetical protein D3924_08100 [Candidatus Electrothrix sp. AR4]|nr:hypothetical protein [Candidatus Electrothrix sp. AR4]
MFTILYIDKINREWNCWIMMKNRSEDIVLEFFKLLNFPGIRQGEGDTEICNYFKKNGYTYTPDLVSGPLNIAEADIGGLFFIDVIEPSTDLLFKSRFYKDHPVDVPDEFRKLLFNNEKEKIAKSIDSLPTYHHQCYLDALNKKLDKYAHQRKCNKNDSLISSNFGLVHHFDLGELNKGSISTPEKLITMLDYIRFYKSLAPSDNIDLRNSEYILHTDLCDEEQTLPCVLSVGRELKHLPCLFFMIHISIIKKTIRRNLALFVLNTWQLDHSDGLYPVHNWFKEMIFHPKTTRYSNETFKCGKVQINVA